MKNVIKKFVCWAGWHSFGKYERVTHHDFNDHYRCLWCGYEGLVDSQGGLF